jgi:glycosyltransferase involved in cell wall biosynthesis
LRIVQVVCTDAFAGVERYVATIARELAARGHAVSVVGGNQRRMRISAPAGVAVWPAGRALPTARRIAALSPFDVVHAHMTAAEFAAVLGTLRSQRPIVATRHFAQPRGSSGVARFVGSRIIRPRLQRQVSISRFVAEHVGEPTTLLPSGVAPKDEGSHSEPTVLVAQRAEKEKQTDVAITAWSLTQAQTRGWQLVVAGEGAERPRLEALANELGLDASVSFIGAVDDAEARMATAGVFLATAPAEPLGLSVLEAMACATPVIAAAGGGHLETVAAASDRYLFPPGDAEACAQRIDELVDDSDARRSYGLALQRIQRQAFDLDRHVDRLVEVYADVA